MEKSNVKSYDRNETFVAFTLYQIQFFNSLSDLKTKTLWSKGIFEVSRIVDDFNIS